MAQYSSIVVDQNVNIPMRDGTLLRADVYRPDSREKHPVLLQRTPYDKSNRLGSVFTIDPIRAASSGYAVVIQDVRGRFASEGVFYNFKDETSDGVDTIDWCGTQSWSTGSVGMYGRSYVGATQWLAAIATPGYLKALAPGVTASQYYDGWTYEGGAFQLWFAASWATSQLTLANLQRISSHLPAALNDRSKLVAANNNLVEYMRHLPLKDFPPLKREGLAPYYYDWIKHETDDDYWKPWKIEDNYSAVTVPAFNYGGWYDIFIGGTLKNFVGMQANGGSDIARSSQKLLIGPWAHTPFPFSNQTGSFDFGLKALIDSDGAQLRWFDQWLKEEDTGILSEPAVKIFVMGKNEWREESQWPPADIQYLEYFLHSKGKANSLHGDGSLTRQSPQDEPEDTFVFDPLNPVPTRGGNLCCYAITEPAGPFDQSEVETRDDVLVYTSPVLEQDTEVTGPVAVVLYAATTAIDTDFTAKLVEVTECGTAKNIAEGIIRARYRNGTSQQELIDPGTVYRYTIDLKSTSNLFKAGHRIRLEISSSNFPRYNANANTGLPLGESADVIKATQTVLHTTSYPSHILLPILDR